MDGLEDVSTYPALFEELANRGWTDENLKKLAGENLIRVLTRTEQVIMMFSPLNPHFSWTKRLMNRNDDGCVRVCVCVTQVSAEIKAAGLTPIETIIPPEDLVAANSTSCRTAWPN